MKNKQKGSEKLKRKKIKKNNRKGKINKKRNENKIR